MRPKNYGLSLVEVIIFFAIVSVAMLAALSVYSRQQLGGRLTEQRRRALLIAEEKIDEIRNVILNPPTGTPPGANPLDRVFNNTLTPALSYGPLPANTGLTRPCCLYNGVTPVFADLPAFPGRALVTVSIINSETPNEANFGIPYDGSATPGTPFGVDINGNRRYSDSTSIAPFPLDINNDGDTSDTNVTNGFSLLPVVVTIQWLGPYQTRERLDVFVVLTSEIFPQP